MTFKLYYTPFSVKIQNNDRYIDFIYNNISMKFNLE